MSNTKRNSQRSHYVSLAFEDVARGWSKTAFPDVNFDKPKREVVDVDDEDVSCDASSSNSSSKRQNSSAKKTSSNKRTKVVPVVNTIITDAASGAMGSVSCGRPLSKPFIDSIDRQGDITLSDEDYRSVLTSDNVSANRIDMMVAAKKVKESKGERIQWHNVSSAQAATFIRSGKRLAAPPHLPSSSSEASSLQQVILIAVDDA